MDSLEHIPGIKSNVRTFLVRFVKGRLPLISTVQRTAVH